MNATAQKVCRAGCSPDPQPLENFYRSSSAADGRKSTCKKCENERKRKALGRGSGLPAKRGSLPPMSVEHQKRLASGGPIEAPYRERADTSVAAQASREAMHRIDSERWDDPKPGTDGWYGF